eukprot:364611-Chlamydomonas_euryale.AAC.6
MDGGQHPINLSRTLHPPTHAHEDPPALPPTRVPDDAPRTLCAAPQGLGKTLQSSCIMGAAVADAQDAYLAWLD